MNNRNHEVPTLFSRHYILDGENPTSSRLWQKLVRQQHCLSKEFTYAAVDARIGGKTIRLICTFACSKFGQLLPFGRFLIAAM